jgi:hypothetical protein
MRVNNKTRYGTRKLRSIFCAVHSDIATPLDTWRHLTVTVVYSRRRRRHRWNDEDERIESYLDDGGPRNMSGHASLDGYSMTLCVPRTHLQSLWLAKLFHHELLHSYGKRHPEYPKSLGSDFWRGDAENYRWILDKHELPELLDEKPEEPPAPKPTKEAKQLAAVQRLIARRKAWVTKARRAATALAKIDKSLRYYQREGIEVPDLQAPVAAKRRRRRRKNRGPHGA